MPFHLPDAVSGGSVSAETFTFDTLMASGLSHLTNIHPNIMVPRSPYPGTFVNTITPSQAWLLGGRKAIVGIGAADGGGEKPLIMHFVASVPGATAVVTFYRFNYLATLWGRPEPGLGSTLTITDGDIIEIRNPGRDPWYPQFAAPSSGTFSIYSSSAVSRIL